MLIYILFNICQYLILSLCDLREIKFMFVRSFVRLVFFCLARQRQMRISPQSVGFFLQPMGFPFDIQGPGSSRNILLHFLHNKAIEDGNQTCSPPFL